MTVYYNIVTVRDGDRRSRAFSVNSCCKTFDAFDAT